MQQASTQVVVMGAGYAGLMAAIRLATKTDGRRVGITLVSERDTFDERVRNHQLAAGQRLRRYPLAAMLQGTRIQFVRGRVVEWQARGREIVVSTEHGMQKLGYDHLLYALGSHVDTASVPGVQAHAYTLDHRSASELARLLPAIAARSGQVLIVGGGNTGVEIASELAEAYPALNVTLVTRRSFARNLSTQARAYIRQAFAQLGVTFVENSEIVQVQEGLAVAADGRSLRFDACIWVAGFAVSDLAQRAGLRVNERRQIVIDRAMRSLSHPEVYAAGDASFPLAEPGAPVRMSLYTALLMGAHAADTLAAQLNGRTPAAFGFSYAALALSLGRHDGVVQFLDPNTDGPRKFIITGSVANRLRETFVQLAVQIIRLQRSLPWIFYWPGKNKLRHVRLETRCLVETGMIDNVAAVHGR